MADYIKAVIIVLFSGAMVVLFLTFGLALLAAAAIIMPFVYWYYRWKIKKRMGDINKPSGYGKSTIIDVEYEIVDEENKDKGSKKD